MKDRYYVQKSFEGQYLNLKHENENYEIGSSHKVVLCLLCNKDDYRFLRTLTKTVQVGNSSRLCQ